MAAAARNGEVQVSFTMFTEMALQVVGHERWQAVEDQSRLWTSLTSPGHERQSLIPMPIRAVESALDCTVSSLPAGAPLENIEFETKMRELIVNELDGTKLVLDRFEHAKHHLYLRHLGERPAAKPGARPGRDWQI